MPAPTLSLSLDGTAFPAELLARVARVEVRESDDGPTAAFLRLKLIVSPTGDVYPLDDDLFAPATPLDVAVAAPGGLPRRLCSGYVTHVRPHFEPIESNCYLEVVVMDKAQLMDAHERVATWPDQSDSEVADAILGAWGLTPSVTATDARWAADQRLLTQRESDWRFLQRLARRNGFRCYLEHDDQAGSDIAWFGPVPLDAAEQADLVMLGPGPTLKWLDVQYKMTGPVRHTGAAIDPVLKRLVRGDGSTSLAPSGEGSTADAVEAGLRERGAEGAGALLRDPLPNDAGLAGQATGRSDLDGFLLEAKGEVDVGAYRNLLRCRRPVLVRGVGRRLAGVWYVNTVRTVVAGPTVSQTFTARRNGIGLAGSESFGQSAEEVEPT